MVPARVVRLRRPTSGLLNSTVAEARAAWPLLVLVAVTTVDVWLLGPVFADHATAVVIQGIIPPLLVVAGIALRADPHQVANGNLLLLSGILWPALYLNWYPDGLYPLAGWVLGPMAVLPLAITLLRYPRAVFASPYPRLWALCTPPFLLAGRAWLSLFGQQTQGQGWWPDLLHSGALQSVSKAVVTIGSGCLAVAFVVLITRRFTGTHGLDRRELRPVAIAAAAAGATVAVWVVSVAYNPESSQSPDWILVISGLFTIVVPLSFYLASLQRRMQAATIAGMVRDIDRASSPGALQRALRHALDDPELLLFVRLDDGTYLGAAGESATDRRPVTGNERHQPPVHVLGPDGRELATVHTNVDRERHRLLFEAALAAASLALESARVYASLALTLEEVTRSRARIVEAAMRERRQVERDLHDGTQQRLMALSMTLASLRHSVDAGERALVDEARAELREAVAELRRLARGIYPSVLAGSGLAAALEGVAERCPIRVDLDVPARRWTPTVETTAYFVACEALTNAVKHGNASHVTIRVRGGDEFLTLAVTDNGVGGAEIQDGGGLAGLRDRVSALGGSIAVVSQHGQGTCVEVTVPTAPQSATDLVIASREEVDESNLSVSASAGPRGG